MRRLILSLMLPALLLAGASHASAGGFDVRVGAFFPRGHESLFADLNSLYTPIGASSLRGVEPKDFIGVFGGAEFNAVVAHNLELGVSFDAYGNSVETSYRDYTRPDGSEIQQRLHLSTYPLGVTLRFVPTGKHVQIAPFIGGGVDAIFYQYEETGDFIDFFDPTLPIVADHFRDHSTAFGFHAEGGVRWYLNRDFAIVVAGRYQWAQKDMEEDFAPNPESGLVNRIDLSGASATVGLHVRF